MTLNKPSQRGSQRHTTRPSRRHSQRGGFAMGLVAGMLVGLALALGVALFITKAPVPFVNKVPQRTADQDSAEIERNRTWDPNAPLSGKGAAGQPGKPGGAVAGAPAPYVPPFPDAVPGQPPVPVPESPTTTKPTATAPTSTRDPAAILSGATAPAGTGTGTLPNVTAPPITPAADPFIYFVQAGAFARSEDADQQRAKLGLMGLQAKITEREQSGRTMYRVRLGPFPRRDEADNLQARLQEQTVESQIVRVEKP
jgi:cell division protein FtsN